MPSDSQQHRGQHRSRVPEDSVCLPTKDSPGSLRIVILHTSAHGTIEAVQETARLADQLQARIQIVVAYVVPYPLPIEKVRVDPEFRLRELVKVCENQSIKIRIDIWLCRDVRQSIRQGLFPNSLVVIGGRQTWWPFTYEKRLARIARGAGHQVVFIATHK